MMAWRTYIQVWHKAMWRATSPPRRTRAGRELSSRFLSSDREGRACTTINAPYTQLRANDGYVVGLILIFIELNNLFRTFCAVSYHYKDSGLLQQNRLSRYMLICGNRHLLPRNDIRWQPLRLDAW